MKTFVISIKCVLGGIWNEDYDNDGNELLGLQAMRDSIKYRLEDNLQDSIGPSLENSGVKNPTVDGGSISVDVDSLKPNRAYQCDISFDLKTGDETTQQALEPLIRSWAQGASFCASGEIDNEDSEAGYKEYEVSWPKGSREEESISPINSDGFGIEAAVSNKST